MIDATELVGLRMSPNGKHLCLRLRDQSGQTISLSLPACWLNAMLDVVPQSTDPDTVHPVDSWSMARMGNGQDLVLRLRTPEGQAVSFAMKSWQIEGNGDDRDLWKLRRVVRRHATLIDRAICLGRDFFRGCEKIMREYSSVFLRQRVADQEREAGEEHPTHHIDADANRLRTRRGLQARRTDQANHTAALV